jgi:hypothetical protein
MTRAYSVFDLIRAPRLLARYVIARANESKDIHDPSDVRFFQFTLITHFRYWIAKHLIEASFRSVAPLGVGRVFGPNCAKLTDIKPRSCAGRANVDLHLAFDALKMAHEYRVGTFWAFDALLIIDGDFGVSF